jgi:hypothetical protein
MTSMRRQAWTLGFAAALAAAGCRRETPRVSAAPTAAAAARPSAAATQAVAGSAIAVPPAASVRAPEAPPALVVRAWSDALDRHDLSALERLYGGSVVFYGHERAKAAVVAAKRAAFERQRGFRQEIVGEIQLENAADGRVSATFAKRSGENAAFSVATAKLVLMPSAQGYVIVEEADAASLRRATTDRSACETKASEVVNALPEVRRVTTEAMRDAEQSDGGARFGGIGPNDDGEGGFVFSLGVHTDERFESRVVASVDRKGALSVLVFGADVPVPAPALRAVQQACRR